MTSMPPRPNPPRDPRRQTHFLHQFESKFENCLHVEPFVPLGVIYGRTALPARMRLQRVKCPALVIYLCANERSLCLQNASGATCAEMVARGFRRSPRPKARKLFQDPAALGQRGDQHRRSNPNHRDSRRKTLPQNFRRRQTTLI